MIPTYVRSDVRRDYYEQGKHEVPPAQLGPAEGPADNLTQGVDVLDRMASAGDVPQ